MMKRSLSVIALCACAVGAQAEVYKWIDADGKVQYGDAPPKNVKAKVVSGGVTVVPATVVPQAPAPKPTPDSPPANGAAQAVATGAADRKPDSNPAPVSAPQDPALAARAEARAKAIERCKQNRGTDCENEADAQYSGEPAIGYAPGAIPGWSQPPIRPSHRPVPPPTKPDNKPVHKPKPGQPADDDTPPPAYMSKPATPSGAPIKPMK
jgi:hypothetical protein